MTKFAAKFGYTRQDMHDSPELHRRLKDRYAKEHGHDTTGLNEWVMIVATDGKVDFFPYWIPEVPGKNVDRGWSDRTALKNPPELL